MQQFPNQQPDASSSEIFQSAQSRGNTPPYQQPEAGSHVQARDIVVYPNRKRIIGFAVLQAGSSLFLILAAIFIASLIFLDSSLEIALIAAIILVLETIIAGLACYLGWVAWETISLIYPRSKPILIINSEGIIAGKMPLQSGFFILWSEIDTVFIFSYYIHEYLCILPKNTDQFLLRFPPLERFFRQLNAKIGGFGSPLYIPLSYSDVPTSEIMYRIRAMHRR